MAEIVRIVDLKSYLPPYMLEFVELVGALESQEPEFRLIWDEFTTALNNQFVISADLDGLERFESMLGVTPLDTDTIEDRKRRVLGLMAYGLPYTEKQLYQTLVSMCGPEGFTLLVDEDAYKVSIGMRLSSMRLLDFVKDIAEKMVPVNMYLDVYIAFNRWGRFKTEIWNTLKAYTWGNLKEDTRWEV